MTAQTASQPVPKKTPVAQERKYKCAYCARAFSRSEHRSRHERSHTKERPFACMKCRSTFVRRDLLLRHDRTVHAKDGGTPLHSEVKRRSTKNTSSAGPSKPQITIEPATIEQLEGTSDAVDLETAAVLMTELHQAAAAAMVDQEQEMLAEKSRRSTSTNPECNSMPFAAGAIPVHNMSTWDPPTPSSTAGYDSRFKSESPAPHDWNSNTLQVPGSHRMSMERSFSAEPSSVSYVGSHVGSPNPYCPGPPSPGVASQATSPPSPPSVQSEHERDQIMDNIRHIDEERAVLGCFKLPKRSALNRYLSAYFNLFHHHFPFLHSVSFHPGTVDPPLLLAVMSVGALYNFEKEKAYILHLTSKVLVNNFLHRHPEFNSRNCPLWTTQTLLLNMIVACWSGEAKGLEWAGSIKGILANMVVGTRYETQVREQLRRHEDSPVTREEWLEDEGCKRTCFAVYIFFGLLTLTYNDPFILGLQEFSGLSLPCSETLWNLETPDDQTWRETFANENVPTFQEAYDGLFKGEPPQYSAYAARVMINALFLEVCRLKRTADIEESAAANAHRELSVALDTWHKALDFCTPESIIVPLQAPQKGHPLVFNALAMYRCTAARLEVDFVAIQEALRDHNPDEVATRMTSAATLIQRSEMMTKVIQLCVECFQIPALMGIRMVARTSALNWSVEHPLCGFDLTLILSLWLQTIEEESADIPPTEEEQAVLEKIRSIFDDDALDMYGSRLSAAVARVWGSMIDEVTVWGITKLLGESFKIHAHSLALGHDAGMTLSSSSASPSPSPETDMDSEMY